MFGSKFFGQVRRYQSPGFNFQGTAVVEDPIEGSDKPGRVRFRGTFWPAECRPESILQKGDRVIVVDIVGITLIVQLKRRS